MVATGQATASEHCRSFENDAVAFRIPMNYRIFNMTDICVLDKQQNLNMSKICLSFTL